MITFFFGSSSNPASPSVGFAEARSGADGFNSPGGHAGHGSPAECPVCEPCRCSSVGPAGMLVLILVGIISTIVLMAYKRLSASDPEEEEYRSSVAQIERLQTVHNLRNRSVSKTKLDVSNVPKQWSDMDVYRLKVLKARKSDKSKKRSKRSRSKKEKSRRDKRRPSLTNVVPAAKVWKNPEAPRIPSTEGKLLGHGSFQKPGEQNKDIKPRKSSKKSKSRPPKSTNSTSSKSNSPDAKFLSGAGAAASPASLREDSMSKEPGRNWSLTAIQRKDIKRAASDRSLTESEQKPLGKQDRAAMDAKRARDHPARKSSPVIRQGQDQHKREAEPRSERSRKYERINGMGAIDGGSVRSERSSRNRPGIQSEPRKPPQTDQRKPQTYLPDSAKTFGEEKRDPVVDPVMLAAAAADEREVKSSAVEEGRRRDGDNKKYATIEEIPSARESRRKRHKKEKKEKQYQRIEEIPPASQPNAPDMTHHQAGHSTKQSENLSAEPHYDNPADTGYAAPQNFPPANGSQDKSGKRKERKRSSSRSPKKPNETAYNDNPLTPTPEPAAVSPGHYQVLPEEPLPSAAQASEDKKKRREKRKSSKRKSGESKTPEKPTEGFNDESLTPEPAVDSPGHFQVLPDEPLPSTAQQNEDRKKRREKRKSSKRRTGDSKTSEKPPTHQPVAPKEPDIEPPSERTQPRSERQPQSILSQRSRRRPSADVASGKT